MDKEKLRKLVYEFESAYGLEHKVSQEVLED